MHSLALLWAWAMTIAVLAVKALELRPRAAVLPALAVAFTLLVAIQVTVNGRVADVLDARPPYGLDVAALLEAEGPATEEERCASLSEVLLVEGLPDAWVTGLNDAYEDRYGAAYCDALP